MRLLVLGGTAWLGSETVRAAVAAGHEAVCLARGESGTVPRGARLVRGDRSSVEGYRGLDGRFDAVVDVARDSALVRTALEALSDRVEHWVFVSSCSVYARHDEPGATEDAELLPALPPDVEATPDRYGEGKVACEQALQAALASDRLLVARAGLIAGPGDTTDRSGYWPLRFCRPADPGGAVLVPSADSAADTQLVDVRDLATWLVDCAEKSVHGVMNASGPVLPLPAHLAAARQVAGHSGDVATADSTWLQEQGVEPFMGEESLPLWIPWPDWVGFMARSTDAAVRAGLRCRPLPETLRDTLAWEVETGAGRARAAGLSPHREVELLEAWRARRH